MKKIFALSFVLIFPTAVYASDAYVCQSIFGDGVDANILVKVGPASDGKTPLPYVGVNDASGAFRIVTIRGLDQKPNTEIQAYGIGTASGNNISLALMNDQGLNIGVMANGIVSKESIRFDLFGRIAGDWLKCIPEKQ